MRRHRHSRRPALEVLENRTLLAVKVWSNFNGLGDDSNPPDMGMAAGPSSYIEALNGGIGIFDKKTGDQILAMNLAKFFNAASGDIVFDPLVEYDDKKNQFVVAAVETNNTSVSDLDVAISKVRNPRTTDDFEVSKFDITESTTNPDGTTTKYDGDRPRFGENADAYYFCLDMVAVGTKNGFKSVQVVALVKSTLKVWRGDLPDYVDYTVAPTVMHNSPAGGPMGGPMWYTDVNDGRIELIKETNPLSPKSTYTRYPIKGPAVTPPVTTVPQPGGNFTVSVMDERIQDAAMYGSHLVATQMVGNNGVTQARWYEFSGVSKNGNTPKLYQWGNIDRGAGVFTMYPAIEVDARQAIGLTFLESSPSEFLSTYVTGRLPSDANGTMEAPMLVGKGTANYTGVLKGGKRVYQLGDYLAISDDPSDPLVFWAGGQYKANHPKGPLWNTEIASFFLQDT
jgi:hypothetical protein